MFGAILGAAALGGLNLLGQSQEIKSQQKMNQRNIDLQRETNMQNEMLMRESWQRDDTAVQRRRADLEAAGLSPLLAAGSAAQNTGPISKVAPKQQYPAALRTDAVMNAVIQGAGIAKTIQDMKLTEQRFKTEQYQTLKTAGENARLTQEIGMKAIDWGIKDKMQNKGYLWQKEMSKYKRFMLGEMMERQKLENIKRNMDLSKELNIRTTDPLDARQRYRLTEKQADSFYWKMIGDLAAKAAGVYTGGKVAGRLGKKSPGRTFSESWKQNGRTYRRTQKY